MAQTKVVAGSDLQLFIGGTTIAAATNCTISMSADATDVSHKDISGWKSSIITGRSWECTTSNLWCTTSQGKSFSDLFSAYTNGTELTMSCGLTSNAGQTDTDRTSEVPTGGWSNSTPILYGKVIVTSLSISGDNGSNASYEATFTGVGELSTTAISDTPSGDGE